MTLGEILWSRIETAEGYAFISDGVTEMSNAEVIKIARNALEWSREVVKILAEFLAEYDKRQEER